MKLKTLCEGAGLNCADRDGDLDVSCIVSDSRRAVADCMFVCVCGLHTDGHAYIPEAVARGARWIVVREGFDVDTTLDVTYFFVKDTRVALAYLLDTWYENPCKRLKLIGVTGTNGKTTVTHMIRQLLVDQGHTCGLIGTLGCFSKERIEVTEYDDPCANMTTPDPEILYRVLARMVEDGMEYVAIEASSHALALGKLAPMHFEVGVFTNLTPEHLDFHTDMTDYANTKATLFEKSRVSVISFDSPWADTMQRRAKGTVVGCSTKDETNTFYASRITLLGGRGVSYTLSTPHGEMELFCPIAGAFSVTNSVQALAVCMTLGLEPNILKGSLSRISGVSGRMERVELDADFDVLIDYAHTPDALQNLLQTARECRRTGGRVILLFGCGGDRDRTKRPVMGNIASRYADYVIVTSDNARSEDKESIIKEILKGYSFRTPCTVIIDRKKAIEHAILTAKKHDVILLAGKGHEAYEIDADGKRPFSEGEIVRQAHAKRIKAD